MASFGLVRDEISDLSKNFLACNTLRYFCVPVSKLP